jgi:hypothetical protein
VLEADRFSMRDFECHLTIARHKIRQQAIQTAPLDAARIARWRLLAGELRDRTFLRINFRSTRLHDRTCC